MCIGIPMQVRSFPSEGKALCEGRGQKENLDCMMLSDLKVGDFVLAWNGIATQKISEQRAQKVNLALDALEQAMSGQEPNVDDAFADILQNTGKLPPHLAQQISRK